MFQKQLSNINAQCQSIIEKNLTLANSSINTFKKVSAIQAEAVTILVQESAATAKNLCTINNIAECASVMQNYISDSWKTCVAKTQEIASVINAANAPISEMFSTAVKGAQETLIKSVDKFSAVNPTISKVASESLQTWISTSNQAADSAAKVSTQVAEVAAKNITSAANATIETVKNVTVNTTSNSAN